MYRNLVFIIVTLCIFVSPLGAQDPGTAVKKTEPAKAPATESAVSKKSAPAEISETSALFTKLKDTGRTGIALLLISIAALTFMLERLVNLRRSRISPKGLFESADTLWEAKDYDGILKLCANKKSALSKVLVEIVMQRSRKLEIVSMLAGDVASREIRHHLQRAYPLAVCATISPLLGLFGTIVGMIGAFETVAVAGEMGDPSLMAGDIAFALITTAIGLVIAVPSLAAYHFFKVRTTIYALNLEELAGNTVTRWFPAETQTDKA
ncbi:MAG: MotA/TolQ/ExbB proton channel family protein [Lentisphaeria bacterium]|nr:MotA/TolQ/ExbB proton channel family protein [Lentisphaeria bacterium]NQZ66896.1 MotA/TolQ/ExbB proton channel family protein [Lentisphaeria bacterium]